MILLISTIIISVLSILSYDNQIRNSIFENNFEVKEISKDSIIKKYMLDYEPGGNRINLVDDSELFLQYSYKEDYDSNEKKFKYTWFESKTESKFKLQSLKNQSKKTIVIIPIFTHSAYSSSGFYDYYNKKCDESCLTVKIERINPPQYNAGKNAIQILKILEYEFISDIEIDEDPQILLNYDKVIVLHNEYVTQTEFEAITNHPHVLYLYPNALYAKIDYDKKNDEITLIRGHDYPTKDIANGFDWEFDNTNPFEYDTKCDNWKLYEIDNGKMLNCYPENKIWRDESLLKAIREF